MRNPRALHVSSLLTLKALSYREDPVPYIEDARATLADWPEQCRRRVLRCPSGETWFLVSPALDVGKKAGWLLNVINVTFEGSMSRSGFSYHSEDKVVDI